MNEELSQTIAAITAGNREAVYDAAIARSTCAIVFRYSDRTIVRATPMVEELFGYRMSAMIGLPLNALLPEELHSVHDQHVARRQAESRPEARRMGGKVANLLARKADGTLIRVEIGLRDEQIVGEPHAIANILLMPTDDE